jgi:hypothetical protein
MVRVQIPSREKKKIVSPKIWDDDEVLFVLDQHTEFDFYSASSLKQSSEMLPHHPNSIYVHYILNTYMYVQNKSNLTS